MREYLMPPDGLLMAAPHLPESSNLVADCKGS